MCQGRNAPIARSLAVQGRVISALLMREIITRYGRNNIGFLWLFVEPMLFTLAVLGLWTASRGIHGSDLPITPFAITGYSAVLLWRNSASRCVGAIEANRSLLFHRNVRIVDVFLARLLLEFFASTGAFIALILIFLALEAMPPPVDPLLMVWAWLMLCWFATGLGLVIGVLASRYESVGRLWHTLTYVLFPLSGVLFMVDWLPAAVREYILLVPMVHGTEMLRSGYFGSLVTPHYDLIFLASVNIILLLAGLLLVRDFAGRVEGE